MAKLILSREFLSTYFEVYPEAGVLLWKPRPREAFGSNRTFTMWNTRFAGRLAGTPGSDGYLQILMKGCGHLSVHRAIWLWVNGPIPEGMKVDHKNGVRDQNSIANLRIGTHQENLQNQRHAQSSNKNSRFLGVSKNNGRWVAGIAVSGKRKHLGYFPSEESAHAAYVEAKRALHAFCML